MTNAFPWLRFAQKLRQWRARRSLVGIPRIGFTPVTLKPAKPPRARGISQCGRHRCCAGSGLPDPDAAQQLDIVAENEFSVVGRRKRGEYVIRADPGERLRGHGGSTTWVRDSRG
jgi:hypothetical protein